MTGTVSHYVRRSQQLGLLGSVRQAWGHIEAVSSLYSRSAWWSVKARRNMSDADLLARTTGQWDTVSDLLEHLADRPGSSLLLPHDSPEGAAHFFRQRYPKRVPTIIALADSACRGEFELLGHAAHHDADIDWHRDPISGWHWPQLHIDRLRALIWSPDCPADTKLVWELNRHQHLVVLGMAYWLTGKESYAETFATHIKSWIQSNPIQHGVNWFSSLEVAIRLIAWTLAFQFFRGSTFFREEAGRDFLKSLYRQTRYLESHLTVWESVPNNHLIGEATGLAVMGAAFPEFLEAARWRDKGLRLLEEQVPAQTHEDGVNKEQATGYHRFVAEFLLVVASLGHRGLLPRVAVIERTLEKMINYVLYLTTPDGASPMWGDADDGRALGLGPGRPFWDFRPLLSSGAVLFQREDWKYAASQFDEEAYWLTGDEGQATWEGLSARQPGDTSMAFMDAGVYVMRDAWAADTDIAFFRCGEFGLGGEGQCAHAHCDLLSLQLWGNGRPLLVDSGTYIYWGPQRDAFRQTAAHNALVIDGREQASTQNDFAWRRTPRARCIDSDSHRVVGELMSASGVLHRREVNHTDAGIWQVTDYLESNGIHELSWYFHFAPGLALHQAGDRNCILVSEGSRAVATVRCPSTVLLQITSGWHSSAYGRRQRNLILTGLWRAEIPLTNVRFDWEIRVIKRTQREQR